MRLRSDGRVGLVFTKVFGFKEPPVEDPESRPDGLESGMSESVEDPVSPLGAVKAKLARTGREKNTIQTTTTK
jgi:hypothetical protein